MTQNTDIIREYSCGLFELCAEDGCAETVLSQSRLILPLLTHEYTHMLSSPSLSKDERLGMLNKAFGCLHVYLLNFMKLMTERGLSAYIRGCLVQYEELYYSRFGIVKVKAESAQKLSEEQKQKLSLKLKALTGAEVEVEYFENPSLIGGMKLEFGNRLIDDSIKSKLEAIEKKLTDVTVQTSNKY